MHAPGSSAPLSHLATAAVAITAARPTADNHGVDITTWIQGGKFKPSKAIVHLEADGVDRTVANPTGGTAGFIELWGYKLTTGGGSKKWYLIGNLPIYNGGATISLITASGGYATTVEIPAGVERVHVAGTPSAGAPTFFVEPIEQYV